jgi:dihydroorotate dehydrogenase (fumarate)
VQTVVDVVKAVMAGAHVTQMVSALLRHGANHLRRVRADLERWLEEHGCESLRQIQGSMSLQRCPDPAAYQRANYIRLLQSWRVEEAR